jgi:cation diffusion facilitator family transporter
VVLCVKEKITQRDTEVTQSICIPVAFKHTISVHCYIHMTAAEKFEKKTLWVVLLTAGTMIIEIIAGIATRSMALLADGIHMGSHVLAIGLSWSAYVIIRRVSANVKYQNSKDKILSLSGYTSGLILLIFALLIIFQSVRRFITPVNIEYNEAIIIACAGLIVNIFSAILLRHEKEEADNNIKAAYLHVIADAVTSVAAITGLAAAMIWNITYVDTVAALVSSLVIIRWSAGLLKESGKVLIF